MNKVKQLNPDKKEATEERRIQFDEISLDALIHVVETRLANADWHYRRKVGQEKKKQWTEMSIQGSILLNLKRLKNGKDQET